MRIIENKRKANDDVDRLLQTCFKLNLNSYKQNFSKQKCYQCISGNNSQQKYKNYIFKQTHTNLHAVPKS